jgi:hypothetical protein
MLLSVLGPLRIRILPQLSSSPHAETRVRLLHSDALDKVPGRPKWFEEIKHDGYP